MAYTTLTVLAADIDGDEIIALEVGANTQGTSGFRFANDGKTMLSVVDILATGAGDTLTFIGVNDKYGRAEPTLARTITAKKRYIYGPFEPSLWNDAEGYVRFVFTTAAAGTTVLAIRCANPQ
jgi:hypothetical protein